MVPMENKRALFQEKVRQSNEACQTSDFARAIRLYTEALQLDPDNHILYSNRSAAHVKLKQYEMALQDAIKARELNSKWHKAYYRQGVALQCLGRHADALAAFSSGLSQDPKSLQLLAGLVEAAVKSPLKETFQPIYLQLQSMKLDKSPFVIISVIGQELLAAGYHASSLIVLESALKIGTCSLKLRGSVFSALSSAHWGLGNSEKALSYMLQDLSVSKSLSDHIGECRAHGNLGAAYFSQGNYKEALTHHRFQLVLAMKQKDRKVAASALSSLGHVYSAIGDYPNALASHRQCVLLAKQLMDKHFEAREVGNVGAVYLALGDFDNALECHKQHLNIAKQLENHNEEARAYSNLGSAYHYKRDFEKARTFHNYVLGIAQELGDRTVEARAYAGLGHASRCMGDLDSAKQCHEQQLNIALSTKDKVMEGRACSNVGIICQQLGQYDAALKLHKAHLTIASDIGDRGGMGRAYGNIGNAHSALGQPEQAVKYHKQELTISREVNDRSSEACTHGNMAVAYQAMNMQDKAQEHYQAHIGIARELKDSASEARALLNLGNYHCSRGEFTQALTYYQQFLSLSKEVNDNTGLGKAYHNLGYAHYSLGRFKEAVHFYEKDLALARDQKDKVNMGRAFCNLGLAYRSLGNFAKAEECQKCFLTIAHHVKNAPGKFRALGNLGDIYMAKKDTDGAIKLYEHQLRLAKQVNNKTLEASAYGALGAANRKIRQFDKALAYHTQELQLCEELEDTKGECKAHSNLGAVHTSLRNYMDAIKCYEEQLKRATELQDSAQQAQAHGNLGISKMNMSLFEDALGYFEEQLATLEQGFGNVVLNEKGRAFGNLAECYEALGDYDEAVRNFEQYLNMSQKLNNSSDQDKAYRGLGNVHRAMGNLQQALFCFEKRLVVAHEMDNSTTRGLAYGELGCLHSLMGNYEQAISCLEHQLSIACDVNDKTTQADAACGLGGVYREMGEHEKALEYHQMDLELAEETGNLACQGRAFGNLGVTNELLGNYQKAIMYQEQHLSIAAQVNDRVAKALAYSSLGRIHHALGNYSQSVAYLRQGLQIADQLGRKEDEAKIRHRLGLALWSNSDLDGAQQQLYQAAGIFETIRQESQTSNEYNLSLLESQSASYQALQRVLVAMGRSEEALAVAERARTRAFVDLLLERQAAEMRDSVDVMDTVLMSVDQILDLVGRQNACVLYYSIAAGHLYSWLIAPQLGIVKFNDHNLNDLEKESSSTPDQSNNTSVDNSTNAMLNLMSTASHLDHYIMHAREALGVDSQQQWSRGNGDITSETESEADELLQMHLGELSAKLAHDPEKSGFLRTNNRNHVLNSSSRSVASVISQLSGGLNGINGGFRNQSQQLKLSWSGRPPLRVLYDMLIAPMEDALPQHDRIGSALPDLVLVLEGDLYLVPFAVLKGASSTECLHERFNLRILPSLKALTANLYWERRSLSNSGMVPALVVANPKMPPAVTDKWGWGDLHNAEQEAHIVADLMGVKPLTSQSATKENVLSSITTAECLHFATLVSWKLSALVLSPGEILPGSPAHRPGDNNGNMECHDLNDNEENDPEAHPEIPPLSEFLFSAADILDLRLTAKLVVLSAYSSDGRGGGRITADSVIGLARAFLAAGAQSVLVPLWPVAEASNKIFMKTLYNTLLQGTKASVAIGEAMQSVRENKQFVHPSNWAGYMLLGCDIRLSNKSAMFGNALGDLLTTPTRCREALRVLLHLIEKSLQRIHREQNNPMYTTQQSIMNKVGPVRGWMELLKAVGFRFEVETAGNSIPPSVFFPVNDPGERLLQASASLQALLGLSPNTLIALSKLLSSPEAASEIITMLQQVIAKYTRDREGAIQLPVNVTLWRTPGCHELLASLGFDLIDVGKEEVLLITGKNVSRRMITYALQGLLAVFDPSEAPKHLPALESFSSMESLCSDQSGNSMSGMSGMSLSGMSAVSIVSTHSLKSGKSMVSNRPMEPRAKGAKDGPRAKLRAKSHFGTSTPVGQDSTKALYETVNPYAAFGAGLSPLASGESPVSSRGSTMKPDLSPVTSGQASSASTPQQPVDEDDYSLAMGPDVTTLLNKLNSQFGDFDTPTPTNSEGTVSLKDHYSSQEYLMPGDDSPLQMATGTINLAFEDDPSDFDHASMRGFGPVRVSRERKSSSRSDSPGEVFHPPRQSGLSPRQSPVRLEPGVTNPGFSRGSSPGYSRGSSSSPGYSRGSSPDIRDPSRRLNRLSPATSQHSSRDSPRAIRESPHEAIAMKILQDTLSHMNAVDSMQRKSKLDHRNAKPSSGPLKSDPAHSAFASNFPKPGDRAQDKNYGPWKFVAPQRKSSGSSTASISESTNSESPARSPVKFGSDLRVKSTSAEQIDKKTVLAQQVTPERKVPPPIRTKPPKDLYEDKLKDQKAAPNVTKTVGHGHVDILDKSVAQRSDSFRSATGSHKPSPSHTEQYLTSTNKSRTLSNSSRESSDAVPTIVRPQAPASARSRASSSSTLDRSQASGSNGPQTSTLSRSPVRSQGPSTSPTVNNSATLPLRKKMNYIPPPDHHPSPSSRSSHSNSSFDSTDSSVSVGPGGVYFKHRPDSAQSTASSSMYSSTSSIPSVIHMPISNPTLNGSSDQSNGGIHAGRGATDTSNRSYNVNSNHSGIVGSTNGTTNSKVPVQNTNYIHQNGSVPHVSGSNHVSDVNHNGDITSTNHRVRGATAAGNAAVNNSNYSAAPRPFANGGIGWSKVNGPTSPKRPTSPTSPTSPRTPASPTARTVRRVYESSQC